MEKVHEKIRKEIKRWLESKNCTVHSEREVPFHIPNRNDRYHLLKHGKLPNRSNFPEPIYKPSLGKIVLTRLKRGYIRVDLLGYKEKLTRNFVIQISHTSDLAEEVKKLEKLEWIQTRIVVRTDEVEGNLNGIPIIPHEKFKEWFSENFFSRN